MSLVRVVESYWSTVLPLIDGIYRLHTKTLPRGIHTHMHIACHRLESYPQDKCDSIFKPIRKLLHSPELMSGPSRSWPGRLGGPLPSLCAAWPGRLGRVTPLLVCSLARETRKGHSPPCVQPGQGDWGGPLSSLSGNYVLGVV